MIGILEMSPTCQTDVLGRTCHATVFEMYFGLERHTNCQDTIAEAISEYGLTPDDVHDSFNFFMNTGIDSHGRPFISRQTAKKGDYVELVALIDVLAVPNVCGADVMATSDFELKPLRIVLMEGTEEDLKAAPEWPMFRNQRSPEAFRNSRIKADRELRCDAAYAPQFTNVPIRIEDVPVELDADEAAALDALKATGLYGGSDAEVLRYVVFSWWIENFMQGPKHFDNPK